MGLKESGLRGSLRNVSVGIDAIPDSAIHQYLVNDFTTSNWPDSVGTSDIETISGLTEDSTAFDSVGGVSGDGIDDFGESDTMGDFGSNMLSDWAISIPIQTTDDASVPFGLNDQSNNMVLYGVVGDLFDVYDTGVLGLRVRGADSNQYRVHTNEAYNDGNPHHWIINKTGNSDGDLEMYVDDMETAESMTTVTSGTLTEAENFTDPMSYFRRGGNEDNHFEGALGDVRWFNDSLDQSDRQAVHDALDWT